MSDRTGMRTHESRDDGAQRILNLLFALSATRVPLTTDQIISDSDLGYGSGERASDLKKFRRDRAALERQGVYVREVREDGAAENEQSSWEIDRARTEAGGGLSARDCSELAQALDRYLARPDIPHRGALARVRAKIAEAAGLPAAEDATSLPDPDPVLDAIWAARELKRSISFVYRDARGRESRKTVEVYGLYTMDGRCYFVGRDRELGEIRTYRADRVRRTGRPREPYELPADFDLASYLFMPFDLGAGEPVEATFSFPAAIGDDELAATTRGRGEVERDAAGARWHVPVRDLRAGAAFALARADRGVRPVAPNGLVDAWNELIDGAVRRDGEGE